MELRVKILLSLMLLVASSPDAYAEFRSGAIGEHGHLRAGGPVIIPPLPATDADLARAERIKNDPDPIIDELEDRLGVRDDGLEIFSNRNAVGGTHVSGTFDGHEAKLFIRW